MSARPDPQPDPRADVPATGPDRLGVTWLARDAAARVARLRRLRRRRAAGDLSDELFRREAERLGALPGAPQDRP